MNSEIENTHQEQVDFYSNILEEQEEINKILLLILEKYPIDNKQIWISTPSFNGFNHAIAVLNVTNGFYESILNFLDENNAKVIKADLSKEFQIHTRKFIEIK